MSLLSRIKNDNLTSVVDDSLCECCEDDRKGLIRILLQCHDVI